MTAGSELMLIVNADDFGRSPEETDAATACYRARRITSVSAMVFMRDSVRAAEGARQAGIPVGLHLNLSEPFTARDVNGHLARAHGRVVRFLRNSKYATVLYHPLLRNQFSEVVHAQFEEFERLYGSQPGHVDGHQHQHLCSNVLFDSLIPRGYQVRRSFSFQKGEKGVLNRRYRRFVDARLARRYSIVDYFFSLETCLQQRRLERVFELAETATVELMAHPIKVPEFNFLMFSCDRSFA